MPARKIAENIKTNWDPVDFLSPPPHIRLSARRTDPAPAHNVWNLEKAAGFAAARLGTCCEDIDRAARAVINGAGFGPGYATPGLPHRTGHGIGLDVHEWPYLVKGDKTVLQPGMTFSNEPTICIYGEFGVRLEDHMVITETGARWFTQPAHSVDDPFGWRREDGRRSWERNPFRLMTGGLRGRFDSPGTAILSMT